MSDQTLDTSVWDGLRELAGDDPSLLTELVDLFASETPALVAGMRDAIASGSAEDLRHYAHTLKGSAMNLGATRLGALCKELEQLGASGTTVGAAALLPQVAEEYDRAQSALRSELNEAA